MVLITVVSFKNSFSVIVEGEGSTKEYDLRCRSGEITVILGDSQKGILNFDNTQSKQVSFSKGCQMQHDREGCIRFKGLKIRV